jgi:uncharacterized coiled-coil protein SlyX
MALWDKVKQELDRAGEAANAMIDEGKVRHEAFRARQLADKAAQALGYAIYRARQEGKEVDTDTYARLSSTLAGHEADVSRLEAKLDELVQRRKKSERPGPRTQSGTTSETTGTPDDGASSSAAATP